MKTHEGERLGGWVRRFLVEHLVVERNLSGNTQRSYRDMLRLLIPFAADTRKTAVDRLLVTDVSADVVRGFLRHIEERRGCGVRTRNQRLAAIHAFATFVGQRCPELIPWCGEARAVPFKRYDRRGLCYLDKPEIDALLAAPDRATEQGRRDHACCCSSTTPARAPARLRRSPSAISTCDRTGRARCGLSAREARRDTVRSGPPR
jgi:site-specific recombinase XerD